MKITYNSQRPDLIIPEYGRSIHKMVEHCASLEDKEERNTCAKAIIKIMGNYFPHLRDVEDYNHKLWDHLHVMSNFEMDVDSPYPKPSEEAFKQKPRPVNYPDGNIKLGHYGKTIEKIISHVAEEKDEEKRKELSVSIANLMKRTYVVWNQSAVRDEVIANDLKKMSNGKLFVENPEEELASTKEVMQLMGVNKNPRQPKGRKRSGGRKGPRKKRN